MKSSLTLHVYDHKERQAVGAGIHWQSHTMEQSSPGQNVLETFLKENVHSCFHNSCKHKLQLCVMLEKTDRWLDRYSEFALTHSYFYVRMQIQVISLTLALVPLSFTAKPSSLSTHKFTNLLLSLDPYNIQVLFLKKV